MALDIPLCRTIKGQKSMSFLGSKIWNTLSSNMKVAATIDLLRIVCKINSWEVARVRSFYLIFTYLLIYF